MKKIKNIKEVKKNLEEIRKSIRAENVSYYQLAYLEAFKKYIDKNDFELLQVINLNKYDNK